MQYETRLIPIMREGIDIIKMVLFRELKAYLSQKYPQREVFFVNRLSGAIINGLFGTPNPEDSFKAFVQENEGLIEKEMEDLAATVENLRIPLTDALRVQFLCDHQDGVDSSAVLHRARELNILLLDREVPLPAGFMNLVRKLGGTLNLLVDAAPD